MINFKAILLGASASFCAVPAIAERPLFQAPFACGQMWRASTYETHGPFAIDLVQREGDKTTIGDRQPVVASAAGTIVLDYTWPSGDKEGERWIFVDHKDGWRTQYVHLDNDTDQPRFAIGRKIATGEILGFTSNSGTSEVHLHYSQRKDVSRSAEQLATLAADDRWGTVLSDGTEKRIYFNGAAIETYRANPDRLNSWSNAKAEKIWSHNCAGGQFAQWYDNGRNMMLRYNPGNGDMRINEINPTNGTNPLRHNANWHKTWNIIVPFYSAASDQPHQIVYNFATGKTVFMRVGTGGGGLTNLGSFSIYSGWTDMVPHRINGKPHLISYDSRYGWFNVDQIRPTNDGFISRLKTKIRPGFTHLIPYEEGPKRYVLMYQGGTGDFVLQKLTPASDGSITRSKVWEKSKRAGWTHLSLLQHQGSRYLLGYNAANGDGRLWKIKSGGTGLEKIKSLNWQKGWTSLTPYYHNGKAHVLLYRAQDGLSRKIRLRTDATAFKRLISEDWADGYR